MYVHVHTIYSSFQLILIVYFYIYKCYHTNISERYFKDVYLLFKPKQTTRRSEWNPLPEITGSFM